MSESCIQHIETYWKLRTNTANRLFKESKYEEALLIYEEALYRAEVLNNHPSNAVALGIPFMQVFAISCNNIAFTYEEMGHAEKGKKMLERVVYYFLSLAKGESAYRNKIQNELKRAVLTYKEFADRNDISLSNQKNMLARVQACLQVELPV